MTHDLHHHIVIRNEKIVFSATATSLDGLPIYAKFLINMAPKNKNRSDFLLDDTKLYLWKMVLSFLNRIWIRQLCEYLLYITCSPIHFLFAPTFAFQKVNATTHQQKTSLRNSWTKQKYKQAVTPRHFVLSFSENLKKLSQNRCYPTKFAVNLSALE